jgi:hypothetical protein
MGDQWFEMWLDVMQVRTPVEQAVDWWVDQWLTWHQAAMRPFEALL